ncbi:MAG: hypothetical protein IKZ19_05905, partial [Clostridia bacterium]|nr:hypothetical protein [Clostridia bacterium]
MKRRLTALLLALIFTALCFSGCGEKPKYGGELTVDLPGTVSGEFGYGQWETSEEDRMIRELTDGGSIVSESEAGEYSPDPRYAESITADFLPDGSKTYTVKLCEDIRWSDGGEVTAADYVAYVLLFSSPAALAAGVSGEPGKYYVGAESYLETGVFEGIRLIDKYSFSVTVKAEYIPYYWEYSYLEIFPLDTGVWLPVGVTVSTNAEGSFFSSDVGQFLTAEGINALRFTASPRRSVGPYSFMGREEQMTVLERNPYYKKTDKNSGPYIDRLKIVSTGGSPVLLQEGRVDIRVGTAGKTQVLLAQSLGYDYVIYKAPTVCELVFQCDVGPTRFAEVRKTLAQLSNCGNLEKFPGIYDPVPADHLFTDALAAKLTETPEALPTDLDMGKCLELLIDGGWTLNAAGEVYTSGLRYKWVTAEEAEDCIDAVVLADGRILMPLRLRFAFWEKHSGFWQFFEDMEAGASELGMEIVVAKPFRSETELYDRLTRNASNGIGYAVPLYNGFGIETPVDSRGDLSVKWTDDWRAVSEGRNICYFEDEELCELAIMLSYGAETPEEFSELLTEHTVRWRETLPEIPICRGTLCDVY